MRLRKIILTVMASATILGVGAGVQPTMIHAHHVRIHRVHHYNNRRMNKKHFKKRRRESHHRFKRNPRRSNRIKRSRKRSGKRVKRSRKHVIKRRRARRYRKGLRKRNKWVHRRKFRKNYKKRSYRIRGNYKRINRIAKPKSNYEIGVEKLTNYFMQDSSGSRADARIAAKSYMNGEYNTSTGDPTIDAILKKYQTPGLLGDTSSSNAPDPNLPTAPQTPYVKAVERRTLYDLNQDRASIGKGPLQVYPGLTHLAEERAVQLNSNFDHMDKNYNDYDDEDDPNDVSKEDLENIEQALPAQTANEVADQMNNDLFYREHPTQSQPYGGGHYNTIASSIAVGVGYYNGNLAEEFHTPDPRSYY